MERFLFRTVAFALSIDLHYCGLHTVVEGDTHPLSSATLKTLHLQSEAPDWPCINSIRAVALPSRGLLGWPVLTLHAGLSLSECLSSSSRQPPLIDSVDNDSCRNPSLSTPRPDSQASVRKSKGS